MKVQTLVLSALALSSALVSTVHAAKMKPKEQDLRTLVRGGCLDESNCCFGKWKIRSAADVYQTDDAVDKTGTVKVGDEVEATSGRVHADPGKMKVVYDHGDWKKGETIGLYGEADDAGRARVGTADGAEPQVLPFLKSGSKCDKPSKDCWAVVLSHPKLKWWIKIKLPEDRTGWIDSAHVATDSECKL
jgi:hypothetical protein